MLYSSASYASYQYRKDPYTVINAYLSRQLPVITPEIEFIQENLGPLPTITPCIDFARTSLEHAEVEDDDVDMTAVINIDNPPAERMPDNNNVELDLALGSVKIPKPSGEPGRPRSGGYSLEAALDKWGEELFQMVNVRMVMTIWINAYLISYRNSSN